MNKPTPTPWTEEEIAHLAIACGFNRSAVAQWQASQIVAKAERTSPTKGGRV